MWTLPPPKGFTLLGLIVAIAVLSAFGLALPALFVVNQSARSAQYQNDQAFYTTHAAFEYALRQSVEDGQEEVASLPSREFDGTTFSITRTDNRIQVNTTKGSAKNEFSIDDPTCLIVDTSSATWSKNQRRMTGITLKQNPVCNIFLTIESMDVTWSPTTGNSVDSIRIEQTDHYRDNFDGPPVGDTHIFGSSFTFTDNTVQDLTRVTWGVPQFTPTSITLVFNFSTGKHKTVVVTL